MTFNPVPARIFQHAHIHLSCDDRFSYKNANFIPIHRDKDGWRFRSEDDFKHEIFLPHHEVYWKLASNEASITYNWHHTEVSKLRLLFGDRVFSDFSEKKQKQALFYEKLVLRYDDEVEALGHKPRWSEYELAEKLRHYTNLIDDEANAAAQQAAGADIEESEEGSAKSKKPRKKRSDQTVTVQRSSAPTVKTFWRKHKLYHECGMDVLALVHRHHGPGPKLHAFDKEAVLFAYTEARNFLDRLKPKYAKVYAGYIAKLKKHNKGKATPLAHVSRKKFVAMIKRFDAYEVTAARYGEAYAIKKFQRIARSYDIIRPGQRVEMDHFKVDLMSLLVETGLWMGLPEAMQKVIEDRRIHFVGIIDVATRYVLALKASLNPKAASAKAALRMMMTDKTALSDYVGSKTPWIGKLFPTAVYSDNGSEFISEQTQSVFRNSGMTNLRPKAGAPKRRPFIESLFHTIGPMITAYFDGRTFSSVEEKGDYDPVLNSTLAVEELIKIFIFAICDVYHRKPHSGLGGNSPHNAWVQAIQDYDVRHPPGDAQMINIFGERFTRTMGDHGVTFMGLTFNSDRLHDLRTTLGEVEINIKVDYEFAYCILAQGPDGWFPVPNTSGLDRNVTVWEWIEVRKQRLAVNEMYAKEGMDIYYDGLNRLRSIGLAATLRANIGPRAPTQADMEAIDRELFGKWVVTPVQANPVLQPEILLADDPLRRGSVEPMPPPRQAITMAEVMAMVGAGEDDIPAISAPRKLVGAPSRVDSAETDETPRSNFQYDGED
ncbi:DDE-type integrase/transposase/recombinase [Rhizobium leguminosarum]|uniref:Integrase catalytic domain-containing protein n=1 Tax=Rhizobium leguminosarum TaxID=384 RepID=A0A2K9Z6U8_RHILE|nr:DDE-type integrase/transposase/recombinase [Rhizobium leguminosarum]AUW43962.1 hypothetical protein CUJ84_Chr003631 [Rhizobium leguminosarum]